MNKPLKAIAFLTILFIFATNHSFSQSTGDYKSNGTGGGNWNTASTWLVYNGTSYVTTGTAPHNISNNIIIQTGDAVTITSTETVTSLTVNIAGSLTVNSSQSMTLGGNITVNGALSISGTLTCSTYVISGIGTF